MQCAALAEVPSNWDGTLTIKCTSTGITFLTEYSYGSRYIGNKKNAVDINGRLWYSASELVKDKQLEYQKFKGGKNKKTSGMRPAGFLTNSQSLVNGSDTQISELNITTGNNIADSVIESKKKSYRINGREVRQRILAYINTQKGKKQLFFWTVTFPAGTPDAVCYQAFNTWLTSLRKQRKKRSGGFYPPMLRDYIWVAERQMGERKESGTPTYTLHFHIAIPHYMDVQRANAMMRGTLKNLAKAGRINYKPHSPQIMRYNGVDIAKNRKTGRIINFALKKSGRSLASYLTKYVTKNKAGVPGENGEIEVPGFEHLAWHNSRGFSSLFTAMTFTVAEFRAFGFHHFLNGVRRFNMNFAVFIPWLYGPPPRFLDHLYMLNSHLQDMADLHGENLPPGPHTLKEGRPTLFLNRKPILN